MHIRSHFSIKKYLLTLIDIRPHIVSIDDIAIDKERSTAVEQSMVKEKMDLVWEVSGIAKVIDRTERQTNHMLARGELPAKKVGGRWVAERGKLIRFFMEDGL